MTPTAQYSKILKLRQTVTELRNGRHPRYTGWVPSLFPYRPQQIHAPQSFDAARRQVVKVWMRTPTPAPTRQLGELGGWRGGSCRHPLDLRRCPNGKRSLLRSGVLFDPIDRLPAQTGPACDFTDANFKRQHVTGLCELGTGETGLAATVSGDVRPGFGVVNPGLLRSFGGFRLSCGDS